MDKNYTITQFDIDNTIIICFNFCDDPKYKFILGSKILSEGPIEIDYISQNNRVITGGDYKLNKNLKIHIIWSPVIKINHESKMSEIREELKNQFWMLLNSISFVDILNNLPMITDLFIEKGKKLGRSEIQREIQTVLGI